MKHILAFVLVLGLSLCAFAQYDDIYDGGTFKSTKKTTSSTSSSSRSIDEYNRVGQDPKAKQSSNVDLGEDESRTEQSKSSMGDVTLTVIGTGVDEEKATLQALYSAIEQTYGAFVSSNTTILNDELVKDEIVSISTGNVKEYSKLAVTPLGNGHISVTLSVTVSINRLVSYAQSKGAKAEFAGSIYAANIKLLRLKAKSSQKAFDIMVKQLQSMSKNLFDFKIKLSEPIRNGDVYNFTATVEVIANSESYNFYNLYINTINTLALTEQEIMACKREQIEMSEIPLPFEKFPYTSFKFLPISYVKFASANALIQHYLYTGRYRYKIMEIDNINNTYGINLNYRRNSGRGTFSGRSRRSELGGLEMINEAPSCQGASLNAPGYRGEKISVGGCFWECKEPLFATADLLYKCSRVSQTVHIEEWTLTINANDIERFKGFEIVLE
ncbi:MAG: hypothetical protein U0K53_01435 [Paludibacteraceae bacterium]|nr:hypothetical protein [Paludibacteraceae bacterium]